MKVCAKQKCLCCEILPQRAESSSRKKCPHVRGELGSGVGGLAGGSQPFSTWCQGGSEPIAKAQFGLFWMAIPKRQFRTGDAHKQWSHRGSSWWLMKVLASDFLKLTEKWNFPLDRSHPQSTKVAFPQLQWEELDLYQLNLSSAVISPFLKLRAFSSNSNMCHCSHSTICRIGACAAIDAVSTAEHKLVAHLKLVQS